MSEAVYSGTISFIKPLIQTFPVTSDTLMILEKLPAGWIEFERHQPDSGLKFTRFNEDEDFSVWGRGRIFNQTAELRWEQTGSGFQVVYIGPPIALSELTADATFNLADVDKRETCYYLWGQRMSKDQLKDINWPDQAATDIFVELQTPRVLRYPVETGVVGRLKLQVMEYYTQQTGHLLMYRFKGVEAA